MVLIATVFVAVVLLLTGKPGNAYCEEQHQLFGSGGGAWLNQVIITVTEPIGLKRVDEPVEVAFTSDKVKPQGEDIRVTDENDIEIPYQIRVIEAGSYKISFFAQVEPYSTRNYHLYFNNPNALKPDYGAMYSALDNQAKTWQTDGLLIGWGGKAGFDVSDTNIITTLKFDQNGDKNPANDLDCLTDDYAWDWFYGRFGSSTPGAFGDPQGRIIEYGPVFSEMALDGVKVRYYRNKKWIMAYNYIDSMGCFDRTYQFMKSGLGEEVFVPDWGPGDIRQGLTGYDSADTNPGYLAFRNPTNGLIFGAAAMDVAKWFIRAKYSGAWDRGISFGDNSNRPDAKVYWYSDTSNTYDGIEQFSKQILNPLKVSIVEDVDPPATGLSVIPEMPNGRDGWLITPVEIDLSASEKSSTYYRIDTDSYAAYSLPITIPEGTHDLNYYSVDVAGNKEEEQHMQFKVDYTKPEIDTGISPISTGSLYFINQPITFRYNATDTVSGISSIQATVNGIPVQDGASVKFSKPGEYEFSVNTTDVAGNEASKMETFTVGYNFKWLPPVKKKSDVPGHGYIADAASIIPIRFQVVDGQGRAVVDKTAKVIVSDGENSTSFTCGKGAYDIWINPCDGKYRLNINPSGYPWLQPGGTYTLSVYFLGAGGGPEILHGRIGLELQ
ncbi:OmpL47-type beta-barrel domain-containing protein [Candidatus Aquicultor sp.]